MILQPSVLALLALSAAAAGTLLYAAGWALVIVRRWDLRSGSAAQLRLERRTYLLSTVTAYVLVIELASLFLFVHTADALAPLFPGAMCAAGTLKAGPLGYPVLILKLGNFLLAGLWLALDHADNQGYDYPLIRKKYAALIGLAALVSAEAALQAAFFAGLRPLVITSCCGSIFGAAGEGVGAELASLPARPTAVAFYASAAGALVAALAFRRTGRGAWAAGALAAVAVPASLAAVIAYLSPYVYELPTHHCPFCLLAREHGFVGYPLYAAVLGGGVGGVALAMLAPFRRVPSLAHALPRFQRRLATFAAGCFALLLALAIHQVATSQLRP